MTERQFLLLCVWLFLGSFTALGLFVLFTKPSALQIEPYTTALGCEGSCSFDGRILGVTDKNETLFYKIERIVPVDAVLFVGTRKPLFAAGDCVMVRGTVQQHQGKDSIIISTISKKNCT